MVYVGLGRIGEPSDGGPRTAVEDTPIEVEVSVLAVGPNCQQAPASVLLEPHIVDIGRSFGELLDFGHALAIVVAHEHVIGPIPVAHPSDPIGTLGSSDDVGEAVVVTLVRDRGDPCCAFQAGGAAQVGHAPARGHLGETERQISTRRVQVHPRITPGLHGKDQPGNVQVGGHRRGRLRLPVAIAELHARCGG